MSENVLHICTWERYSYRRRVGDEALSNKPNR